ncbi:distal membrane-arm assembly complex protein 2-like [Asterias amurensis]|uniref:distal membrane-arm assembly complex protein 2-like n=1 Tax=Asterias amurensis TaxID=7602 RepID=UPI003AB23D5C
MSCGSALRLVLSNAPTVCTCCQYASSVSQRNFRTILSPLREQVTYSQYRQMSLLYFLKKLPQRFKEFKKFEANVTKSAKNEEKYPPDVAAFLWLIDLNGKVRFTNGKWYSSESKGLLKPPPIDEIKRLSIDAIDAKETLVDYRGMLKITRLKELKFLSLEGCPYIDDSCLARLVHIQDSLTHLNISKCPQITEHGFPSLTRLRNLKRINMSSLPRVPHSKVVASMLEDVLPNLKVSVITEEVEYHRRQRDKWKLPPVSEETTPKQEEKSN